MGSAHDGLNVAVIGAGIAGLAAGICLRRAGHAVTIYERSEFKNEVGAAINMPPHAVRILQAWGIAGPEPLDGEPYVDSARGKRIHGSRGKDFKTGEVTLESSYNGDEQLYGARTVTYHRADLHSAMRRVAEDNGASIVLGQAASDVDCDTGKVTLVESTTKSKSTTIQADLVVVADGVRSSFLEAVTREHIPLINLGMSVFRMLIPVETLLQDPETAVLFKDSGEHFSARTLSPHTGVFVITYPCRSGEVMNVAIFHKPTNPEDHELDWNTPANIADAEAALEGFHPAYKAILKHATEVKIFSLSERAPLPTYVNGQVLLIGDAAHPMLPTVAGGGTTSLEDAAALEILLSDIGHSNVSELAQRLSLFDALRRPRDSMTQVLSRSLLSPRPATSLAPEVRHFYAGELPDVIIGGSTKETREFIYVYDVYEVTKTALAWAKNEGFPEDMLMRLQEGIVKHFGR